MLDTFAQDVWDTSAKLSIDSETQCLYRALFMFRCSCVELQAHSVNVRRAKDGAQVANERQLLGPRYFLDIVPASPLRTHP